MANYIERESVTCAVLGKNAHLQSHMDKIYSQSVQATRDKLTNTYTHSSTHIYTSGGQHMERTTQEGAASLKIMKIPLQPGAAQQAEAALHLHGTVYGGLHPTWLQWLVSAGREP